MRKRENPISRNKKNYRSTKSGAGMTKAGVAAYRRANPGSCLLYTSPSPRDRTRSRMPSSA